MRRSVTDSAEPKWGPFAEVVRSRRTIRAFSTRLVPDSAMREILELAVLAPTSSNLQPFELVWVRDDELRDRLIRACLSQSAARTAAELIVAIARWDRCDETRRELIEWEVSNNRRFGTLEAFYYEHLARWTYDPGPLGLPAKLRDALLAPLRPVLPMPRGPRSRRDVRAWALRNTAMVCGNLMLAARAKGLDTCPMDGCDPVRVGKVVGMRPWQWKRTWDLAMVVAVGHRIRGIEPAPRWRRHPDKLVREI